MRQLLFKLKLNLVDIKTSLLSIIDACEQR